MNTIIRSIFLLTLFTFLGCQDSSPMMLEAVQRKDASHLGKGVYLTVPAFFDKAHSYDGYQMVGHSASISVDIVNRSLENVKISFDPKILSQRKTELLEMRPVEFGSNKLAFYSKVRDKRKKTIKYLLAIANGVETYLIKAFCFDDNVDVVGPRIERALRTTFIGNKLEEKPEFLMAKIYTTDHLLFTRDGKFPTESMDSAIVEHKVINKEKAFSKSEGQDFLKNEFSKYFSDLGVNVVTEELIKGNYQYVSGENNRVNVFLALFNKEKETLYVKCSSKNSVGINYFKNYIRREFLQTTVVPR